MAGFLKNTSQSGYVFMSIAALGVLGIALLIVQALAQSGWGAGWRYLAVGGLAAISAVAAGGAIGLIFGLPENSQVIVSGISGTNGDESSAAQSTTSNDWYRDSSSLERIATWLTGAIIALSLANFDSWTARFDHAAVSVGLAMQGTSAEDLDAASNRASAAQFSLSLISRRTGETADVFDGRRKAAEDALHVAQAKAIRATSEAKVPGALIIGGYALLGFLAAYLWTRRYLPAELAAARRDMRQITRLDGIDSAALAAALANNLTQGTSKSAIDPKASAAAAAAASSQNMQPRENHDLVATQPFVAPGKVQDDPWKGQFGGASMNEQAELVAGVREVRGKSGVFLVSLTARGRNATSRADLAGTDARLYLHPTFPEPIIRPIRFDPNGIFEITMAAVGAFTVGIQLLPDGSLLELDLSNLRDAPAAFRLN